MVSIEELMKTGGNYAIYGASGIEAMIETPDVKRFEKNHRPSKARVPLR
ncbi:hypothetical protein [Geomicrobium sp. JCM 19055]|nr:hypothetical protein [Geomicrobium sp. JCM 19055]